MKGRRTVSDKPPKGRMMMIVMMTVPDKAPKARMMMIVMMTVSDMAPKAKLMMTMTVSDTMVDDSNYNRVRCHTRVKNYDNDDSNADNDDSVGHHDQCKNYDDDPHTHSCI